MLCFPINFKPFGSVVEQLLAKGVEKFSIALYEKMGLMALSYPPAWLPPYTPKQIF